ncbi:preprotein translocase subunit SecA [Candidatus Uhrbacteria bacterium]|nr:preprotein translocase subunit SecA [Candidatus Uhrbacteria bacterium]
MSKFLKILFGDPNKKVLSDLQREVDSMTALEPQVSALTDEELKTKTVSFKERLLAGESLDAITDEAFAVVRETAKRTLGQRHFDVQLMGGLVMHKGGIAEMRTGEGKTLTSTAPLYLNALTGKGCHLVTVNDYLARRDAVWMGQVFHALGLSVGCVQHEGGFVYDPNYKHEEGSVEEQAADETRDEVGSFRVREDYLRPVPRKEAYGADITYGTNNQFGFDYLRDNMAQTLDQMVMRDLHFAIVDEIDSILIDEARTPLIISAPAEESNELYHRFSQIVATLKENDDYNVDEKLRTATFTDAGIERVEKAIGIDNLYAAGSGLYARFADTALRAMANYKKDVHYIVKEGEVIIVDEFTGRIMPGRRFSEGIHQAIEAKEGVEIQKESQTLATITFQNLFRMYDKLSGMTGTAATEAEEFAKIYNLEVTEIPTNVPVARADLQDRIYKTERGKFQAVVQEIKQLQQKGQPILVGTISVEKNEMLSELLSAAGVRHEILNAKNHAREAEIIAQAGRPGAVTIATNMAGRGVDIRLGGNPPVAEDEGTVKTAGGLHVIGTERHDSRRIDNQLRGRSGRQGDPGSTQFYISMEDDLMRIFGSDRTKGMMDRLGIPEDMPIENGMVTRSIEKAQERVEGHHFDTRKHLLEYDDVLNKHREVIYARRREVLDTFAHEPEKLRERILDIIEGEVEQVVLFHMGEVGIQVPTADATRIVTVEPDQKPENVPVEQKEIIDTIGTILPLSNEQKEVLRQIEESSAGDKNDLAAKRTRLIGAVMEMMSAYYDQVSTLFDEKSELHQIERGVILRAVDVLWIDHLAAMGALRTGIGLRGYGQRDPLIEYKKEGYVLYQELLGAINREITYSFFKFLKHAVDMRVQVQLAQSVFERKGVVMSGADKGGSTGGAGHAEEKVGRNDPCPCGSGKKYKKCHLILSS